MATSGVIASIAGTNVGTTWQRTTGATVDLWMRHDAGDVTEDRENIWFSVGGCFAYAGYDNYVPMRVGWLTYKSDGTYVTSGASQHVITRTYPADKGKGYEYYARFRVAKQAYPQKLLTYIQVGCVNRWGSDGTAGNFWVFGNEYGIMEMNSDSTGSAGKYTANTWPYTANGSTLTLQCFTLCRPGTGILNGSNSVYTINAKGGLEVYKGANNHTKAIGIYVYDGNKKARHAKTVTVYDGSKKPHTVSANLP